MNEYFYDFKNWIYYKEEWIFLNHFLKFLQSFARMKVDIIMRDLYTNKQILKLKIRTK
jgi:hypothetical protein